MPVTSRPQCSPSTRRFLGRCLIVALSIALAIVSGCRTAGPTLPEAASQRVTLDFAETGLAPPPRTIDDLRPVIGELPAEEPACSTEPTVTAEDVTRAMQRSGNKDSTLKNNMARTYADIQEKQGNFAEAATIYRQAIRWLPPGPRSRHRKEILRAAIARCYAHMGDFKRAQRYLTFPANEHWTRPHHKHWAYANYYRSRANLEQRRGRYALAEAHFRKAIDFYIKAKTGGGGEA